ncbi:2'-5' RNA ligase family protein [Enterobacter ludwigii]|uniref:2'-5' RNA ligase family protein n=1 Tax=Enterobacter ludwigii TaxID=299767 RepID=UPI001E2D3053|nr:2'-5' RNA ligase family protein [Enterobacter ludwigii]MCE1613522.1 2'-5' RNA ligase family protein [Enterobacter ludwigii]MCE1626823.1 2'-5' RNA ligase family protein [Enterobacter ludwigii]
MKDKLHRHRLFSVAYTAGLIAIMWSGMALSQETAVSDSVTAIDILLEPDAAMVAKSEATNARLRRVYQEGYALDGTHRPHVTIIQRFVRTAELENVYMAANAVLANTNVKGMRLEAFKYFYIPTGKVGLAGIAARPSLELLKLQADLLAAVAPYTVKSADSAAFVTTPGDPVIDPVLIEYVSAFGTKATGEKYSPHVTVGIAPRTNLDQMLEEPFEALTFSPVGVAVYQLGQFGVAAKKLRELSLFQE